MPKKKTKVAVFDIDGTIFRSSLLIELTEALIEEGILPAKVRRIYAKTYKKWLDRKGDYRNYIDGVVLAFEKNIKGTKEVVDYVKSKNPEISVEGELGYLRGESRIQKEVIKIKPEDLTKPEEAVEFADKTGIDRFAGAYGNSHGIFLEEPALDIERIKAVRKTLPEKVVMVLHGGSGIPDSQIKEAIKAGIANIHINTEIRTAYAEALRKFLADNPEETTPYKILAPAAEAIQKKVEEKLKLFGWVNI